MPNQRIYQFGWIIYHTSGLPQRSEDMRPFLGIQWEAGNKTPEVKADRIGKDKWRIGKYERQSENIVAVLLNVHFLDPLAVRLTFG